MRAFAQLWDEITRERYGVEDPKQRRLRYGVQVNSLGLTEAQPENNVQRIVLEMLAVTLSRDARARAVQLPGVERGARPAAAVGPAVGAAHAAGARLRDRPAGVRGPLRRLAGSSRPRSPSSSPRRAAEIDRVQEMGGAVAAVESGYMKGAAGRVAGGAAAADGVRRGRRGRGQPVRDHRAEPAAGRGGRGDRDGRPGGRGRRRRGDPGVAGRPRRRRGRGRAGRAARRGRRPTPNLMEASIACAKAGRHDRRVGGGAARGVRRVPGAHRGVGRGRRRATAARGDRRRCASGCGRPARSWAPRLRMLVGKPGPRRALQRRRAGRRAGPRRRLRGGLPGHPAHARRRSWRPRCRRTCTWSGCRCCPARTWRSCPPWSTGCARRAPTTCRWSSAASSRPRTPTSLRERGRRRGVHAEGLPAHRDDRRDRRRSCERPAD